MVKRCIVCNRLACKADGISLFAFPSVYSSKHAEWLKLLDLPPSTVKLASRVCSLHFRRDGFKIFSTFRQTLNENAVPSERLKANEPPYVPPLEEQWQLKKLSSASNKVSIETEVSTGLVSNKVASETEVSTGLVSDKVSSESWDVSTCAAEPIFSPEEDVIKYSKRPCAKNLNRSWKILRIEAIEDPENRRVETDLSYPPEEPPLFRVTEGVTSEGLKIVKIEAVEEQENLEGTTTHREVLLPSRGISSDVHRSFFCSANSGTLREVFDLSRQLLNKQV